METIVLNEKYSKRTMRICITLSGALWSEFIDFLHMHSKVFIWSYDDMPGISLEAISHPLSLSPTFKPMGQKRLSYDTKQYEAMKVEVEKLSAIGFIRGYVPSLATELCYGSEG